MEKSSWFKHFVFLGVRPDRPVGKLRTIFNCSLVACICVLSGYKAYTDQDLAVVDRVNGLLIVTVKYLGLTFCKEPMKRMLAAMDNFWNSDVTDDQANYYTRYFKRTEKMYINMLSFAFLVHVARPFVLRGTSIFTCYIPSYIPFPLFYVLEFYAIMLAASSIFCFNIFVCFLINSATTQFRLINLKIENLNVIEVENDHDLEMYIRGLKSVIKHQQFLMSFIDDLNELLCVPLALLMAINVPMMCLSMYVRTTLQGSMFEECRFVLVIFTVTAEYFLIYGLPAQLMMDESAAIADTLYFECKWYSPKLRPLRNDILIMMVRGQKGVWIRAGNYHVINNRTILLMVKTAYSFHTFLQNVT